MRLPRRGIDDPDHGPRLLGIDLGRRQCRPCTVPDRLPGNTAHAAQQRARQKQCQAPPRPGRIIYASPHPPLPFPPAGHIIASRREMQDCTTRLAALQKNTYNKQ